MADNSDDVAYRSATDSGYGGSESSDTAAPKTLRVLLAATVAGNAGISGNAGASGSSGSAGTAGRAASAGVSGVAGGPVNGSVYCGDSRRNANTEECDEGLGSPGKFCNWACQLQDNWASHSETTVPAGSRVTRHLGRGRHPVAAGSNRFAVAVVEQITPSEQQIRVASYNDLGVAVGDTVMSTGTWVADRADPVVATLPSGDVLTAYTEFGGDQDGLGIALRRLRAGQTTPDAVAWVSSPNFAAQYDADILALSDRVLVAYTDEFDATTGPDITLREFGLDLAPIGTTALGATSDVEGRVALSPLGSSWGAVWRRAAADGTEYIDAYDAATGTRWSIGPHTASDGDDLPSMAYLDATRRLVLYTRDAAATGNQIPMRGQLYFAVLDTAQPSTPVATATVPLSSAYATNYGTVSARRPSLLRVDNSTLYMAWSTAQKPADPYFANGEEVWYRRITPTLSTSVTFAWAGEQTIPRWSVELLGDQRTPALALLGPGTNQPGGALISAWEDDAETLGTGSGEPEVVAQMAALTLKRDATTQATDCSTTALCGAGKGRCAASNQCQSGLVCGYVAGGVSNGPKFGYGTDIGVCVASHCTNGVMDSTETGKDCGGADCGTCLCGDSIVSTELGEVCDTGGNTASCDNDCTPPVCGDGLVNTAAGEQCDLGAGNGPGAACLSNCTIPPSCTNAATCLSVSTSRRSTPSNQIGFNLRIINSSGSSQALNGLSVRYWFTGDGSSSYTFACDAPGSKLTCSNVTGAVTTFSPVKVGADRLLTITLSGTSATLDASGTGNNTGDLQLRLTKTDNTVSTQTNDYSYPEATLITNTKVGMYRNSLMIWGTAPNADYVCGSPSTATDLGEACDPNVANTNCNATCNGFNVVNGKACTNASHCLSVEAYSNDSTSDNVLRPYFRIVNRSGVPVELNRMKLKYWFTSESTTAGLTGSCTWGPAGANSCGQMNFSVARISPTFTKADAAVTLTFSSSIVLGTTDLTGSMQVNVNRSDWGNMTESTTSDWSYVGASAFTTAPKVALYVDNLLWWGEEAK